MLGCNQLLLEPVSARQVIQVLIVSCRHVAAQVFFRTMASGDTNGLATHHVQLHFEEGQHTLSVAVRCAFFLVGLAGPGNFLEADKEWEDSKVRGASAMRFT